MTAITLLRDATRLLFEEPLGPETLQRLVDHLAAACRFPALCCARIAIGPITVTSGAGPRASAVMATQFAVAGATGTIEVWYTQADLPVADEGPFLTEERQTIEALGELIRHASSSRASIEDRRTLDARWDQAQKMETLGTLAGGIAHDFNNILATVIGNTRLALEETGDTPVRGYLQEIARAAQRAADLVQRILVFSRATHGTPVAIGMGQAIEDALGLIKVGLTPTVEVTTDIAADLPLALVDPAQLREVLMSLSSNAADAMRDTGGALRVTVQAVTVTRNDAPAPELTPGRYLCLTVADTGRGIAPEHLDRIFEPFFSTKGARGSGLGLSTVYGMVHDHHGAITVESHVGVGTAFHIYLPTAPSATPSASATPTGIVRGRNEHILYVDDEEPLGVLTTRVLTRMGYRCTSFSDPRTALRAFTADPMAFDAVVTDLAMPDLDGASLLRAMRDIRPDVPMAVTSGFGDTAAEQAMHGLVVPRIPKPASPEALSAALYALLAPRRQG